MGYYFIFNNQKHILSSFSIENIARLIYDEVAIVDERYDLYEQIPSWNKIKGCDFDWNELEEINDVFTNKYGKEKVSVYDDADTLVASYSVSEICKNYSISEDYICAEAREQDGCMLFCQQLDNFIDKSSWNLIFKSKDDGSVISDIKDWPNPLIIDGTIKWYKNKSEYKPLMWFGVEGEDIIDIWVINNDGLLGIVEKENGLGSFGRQMQVDGFEVNYDLLFDGEVVWYFYELAEEGSDFHKIIETCPVDLVSLYRNKNGDEMINTYCYNMYLQQKTD